ncbi:cytochrome P450 [Streptomyces sp. SID10853]|uniref:cytochrome P450 family protein n=1 Tax=Streptomyces sp. SID10853 TaxID=2706028 RepID=UPI0013C08291|nr:cytochrome P450 [Streptomyces sp. SID10853]NDZ78802.1 cytochrome P450 [Streptomyces sp. SID10853]
MTSSVNSPPADLPDAPFGPAWAADPYPAYARLREEGPVRRVHIREGLDPWVVSRYAEVKSMLGDPRLSTDPAVAAGPVREAIGRGRPEEKVSLLGRHLLSTDPPEHTSMRRLMSRAMTPRHAASLDEPMRRWAAELLDAAAGRERFDLLADYAVPLAVEVGCRLLGVPQELTKPFHACARAFSRAELDEGDDFAEAADELGGHLVPWVLGARERGGDDGLVALLAAGEGEEELDPHQLVDVVFHLFFSGYESSAYFVCNTALLLLTHPEQREQVRARPELMEAVIEEALRLEGSVKVPTWRFANQDFDLAGVQVRSGDAVLALLNSAGRDPDMVDDPDSFRLDRGACPHLAFSHGIHHCLGAAVGRLEGRVALSALFERFPAVRLAVPAEELQWRDNLMMRGVTALPVVPGPDTSGVR